MSEHVPDDKIQSVVGLVLQAVDQRLATVREQLVQITNSVARSHADLQTQIDEVREACMAGVDTFDAGGQSADAAAARQLVDAANALTERVTFLEARVNQYTNDRVAELHSAIERLNIQLGGAPSIKSPSSLPLSATNLVAAASAPALSVVADVATTPSVNSHLMSVADASMLANNVAPAAARLVPLAATPKQASDPAAKALDAVDIEQLSAQMGERLSAAIERAIGT